MSEIKIQHEGCVTRNKEERVSITWRGREVKLSVSSLRVKEIKERARCQVKKERECYNKEKKGNNVSRILIHIELNHRV